MLIFKLFSNYRLLNTNVTGFYKNKLSLKQFKERRTVSDDTWNCVKDSEVHIQYLTSDDTEVGFINYRLSTGQIGLLFITNEKYIRRGLGTQMVERAINEMKQHKIDKVWAVTRDNHEFWEKVLNFQPSKRPHKSVTGSGYELDIRSYE